MNNLEIEDLCKKYPNFALNNISLTVPKGSIVGFIGENGAGKTTTIKAILGLIKIDSGKINTLDKSDIGIILDNSFFPKELKPLEINRIMKNIYESWDENIFYDYLNKFNLDKNKIIKEFSTGMLMKLKIITALSHKPKLLILDEPTSGLDPIARSEILDIFQEFIEDENNSIFVSSHITSDLEHVADYIIFINNGEIILNCQKDELLNKYAIVKCNEKEFKDIDKKDFLKCKKNKYDYWLLVDDKNKFRKKYKIGVVDKATLDEIMLLYIRGE